jgi:hypothetical protein
VQLFLTLAGVTLMFTQAQLNGTLDRVAHAAVRVCRGNAGLIPVMFFALACLIASVGPGNVATARDDGADGDGGGRPAGIPPVPDGHHGRQRRQAGALSPFAPTGIIVTGLMMKIGLGGTNGAPTREPDRARASSRSAAISCSAAGAVQGARLRAAAGVAGTIEFTAKHG